VHLVGLIINKFVAMHGHRNAKENVAVSSIIIVRCVRQNYVLIFVLFVLSLLLSIANSVALSNTKKICE